MRVLLVSEQFRVPRSGVGTYARGLLEGLLDAGHRAGLAVCRGQEPETADHPVIPLDTPPGNLTALNRGARARALRRALAPQAGRFELVHFLDARWWADTPWAPCVGTVHDSYALDWTAADYPRHRYPDRCLRGLHYAWLRRHERRVYRRFTLLLSNSRHVANAVTEGYGLARTRLRVVRLAGASVEATEPDPLPGDPAVLFVGANFARKGLAELLEAVAEVSAEVPGLRLHVVGGDRRADHYARLARRGGIADRVTFHGPLPPHRVQALLAGADLFAMPSHVEALGLVYLEALRHGVPVIASARGGIGEILENGRHLLLVSPEGVADALRELALSPERRRTLGEAGRAAAAAFTVERTVRETLLAYEAVLGGGP